MNESNNKQESEFNQEDIFSGHSLSFDQGIAFHCGVNAALIFNHICYWLRFNEKNPESQKEGKVWMYETQEKMADFFAFLGTKEVKNSIKILVDHGLLIKKNFNKNPFDHTNWYTLSDRLFQKVFSKVPKRPIDEGQPGLSESPAGDHQYKEEIKTKEETIITTTLPPPKSVVKKSIDDGGGGEKIYFKNTKEKTDYVLKSDLFLWALKYPTEVVNEAIEAIQREKVLIGNIKSYFLAVCDRILHDKRKIIDEEFEEKKKKSEHEIEKEAWKRKNKIHMEKLKAHRDAGLPHSGDFFRSCQEFDANPANKGKRYQDTEEYKEISRKKGAIDKEIDEKYKNKNV